jgi:NADH-quinone oxidoreductase subunit K
MNMTADLQAWLLLSAVLFSTGIYGILTRKNTLGILISIELMVNAININLVAFGWARGDHTGQVIALFGIALTVAEVAVGLALLIQMSRTMKSLELDRARELNG